MSNVSSPALPTTVTNTEGADVLTRQIKPLDCTQDLIFKFISHPTGLGYFSYVSESAPKVIGLSPRALCNDARRLLGMIVSSDQEDFLRSLELSKTTLLEWRWEGRIAIPGSADLKSIRLRAGARSRMDGRVVWDGLIQHTEASHEASSEPMKAGDQLALLASLHTRAREDERLRIAQDLHDDVGGHLAGIKFQLAAIQQKLSEELMDHVGTQLHQLDALIDRTIDSTRRLTSHLRPPILDLGLVPALEWLVEDFNRRAPAVIELCIEGSLQPSTEEIQIGVFRICQESLNNAFKHAEASQIKVRLESSADQLILEIIDNGAGFKQEDCRRSNAFGLSGMMERATQLGGRLSVESAPHQGTCVRLTIPDSV